MLERAPKDEPAAPPARLLRSVRWGLVPSWAKDVKIGSKMINARVETLLAKPAFKSAAKRRRCVIPADGYFEWMKVDNKKVPFFLHAGDGQPLAMAGLYELRPDPDLPEDDPTGGCGRARSSPPPPPTPSATSTTAARCSFPPATCSTPGWTRSWTTPTTCSR